ncbi:MAG: hypothetical protein R3C30_10340 [Hyphomonadaceae bacterium]
MLARLIGGAALAFGLMAAPAPAQQADVLGPARAGQLQCFEPNVSAKTCQSIGGYTFNTNGVIDNTAQVLVMPQPVIVMNVTSPVTVRNNAICGPLTAEDIQRASFTIDGAPASAADTAEIRSGLTEQLAPILNVEGCVTLTPDGDGFRADTSINGAPQPQLVQRVIWIGANDGWSVAP